MGLIIKAKDFFLYFIVISLKHYENSGNPLVSWEKIPDFFLRAVW